MYVLCKGVGIEGVPGGPRGSQGVPGGPRGSSEGVGGVVRPSFVGRSLNLYSGLKLTVIPAYTETNTLSRRSLCLSVRQ